MVDAVALGDGVGVALHPVIFAYYWAFCGIQNASLIPTIEVGNDS
jgi:hypothetical protein